MKISLYASIIPLDSVIQNIANICNVFKFTIQNHMRMSILEWEAGSIRERYGA